METSGIKHLHLHIKMIHVLALCPWNNKAPRAGVIQGMLQTPEYREKLSPKAVNFLWPGQTMEQCGSECEALFISQWKYLRTWVLWVYNYSSWVVIKVRGPLSNFIREGRKQRLYIFVNVTSPGGNFIQLLSLYLESILMIPLQNNISTYYDKFVTCCVFFTGVW